MEVTVIREGRPGIIGLGAEEAVVRVELLPPVPELGSGVAQTTQSILEQLITLMGVTGSVVSQVPPLVQDESETGSAVAFDISGEDLGILIGRRGQTLASLQYMVRLIINHQMKSWVPIVIDVEGYKRRRYQTLQALAQRMAEQVKARAAPFTLEPMPAYERRIIHLTLADHPDVITQSTGEGEFRKVVILPREQ